MDSKLGVRSILAVCAGNIASLALAEQNGLDPNALKTALIERAHNMFDTAMRNGGDPFKVAQGETMAHEASEVLSDIKAGKFDGLKAPDINDLAKGEG